MADPPTAGSAPAAPPAAAGAAAPAGWRSLGTPPSELQLDFCLPTGQSFRWRATAPSEYTGVIGPRLVALRQLPADVVFRVLARGSGPEAAEEGDEAAVRDYFYLPPPPGPRPGCGEPAAQDQDQEQQQQGVSLAQLTRDWSAACGRFAAVSPYFPGARMLRQDPHECLFQFICSSNNHISRIHGMVERLCSAYGTPLTPAEPLPPPALPQQQQEQQEQQQIKSEPVEQLQAGTGPLQAAASAAAEPDIKPETPGGKAGQKGFKRRASAVAGGKAAGSDAAAAAPVLSYYAFPSLEQLAAATEEELRAAGFGCARGGSSAGGRVSMRVAGGRGLGGYVLGPSQIGPNSQGGQGRAEAWSKSL